MAIQKSGIKKVIALLCTITVLVFVCQTTKMVRASAGSPEIVFIQQYTNNAWTHQHYGYFINNKGEVRNFDLSAGRQRYTTDEEFLSYLESLQDREVVATVNLKKLKYYSKELKKIAPDAKITQKHVAFDFGQTTIYGFLYHDDGTNSKVLILSKGDVYQENTDSHAQRIIKWFAHMIQNRKFPQLPTLR